MNADELSAAILERLHPEPYPHRFDPEGSFDFVLMRASALIGGRYAFAFLRLGDRPVDALMQTARAEARRQTGALWMLREVGLYLMICGPADQWKDQVELGAVDRTGLHHIIVQCVHFVDPETGANHLNRSSWGPVKFGGLIPIDQMVGEVIRGIGEGGPA